MLIFTLTHTNTHKTHLQSAYALGAQCRWAYTPQSYQHILNATYQKKRSDLPFLSLSDRKKGEKRGSIYARAEYNLYLNKVGRQCAIEQTIICRQLFAGDVVSARPMKRWKSVNRVIIRLNVTTERCYYNCNSVLIIRLTLSVCLSVNTDGF